MCAAARRGVPVSGRPYFRECAHRALYIKIIPALHQQFVFFAVGCSFFFNTPCGCNISVENSGTQHIMPETYNLTMEAGRWIVNLGVPLLFQSDEELERNQAEADRRNLQLDRDAAARTSAWACADSRSIRARGGGSRARA